MVPKNLGLDINKRDTVTRKGVHKLNTGDSTNYRSERGSTASKRRLKTIRELEKAQRTWFQ